MFTGTDPYYSFIWIKIE